jgi:uncharacterized protein
MMIGRKNEIEIMKGLLYNDKAELLAILGRRRVGKTYLVKQIYMSNMTFDFTGTQDASSENQLQKFQVKLHEYFPKIKYKEPPLNWAEAFVRLKQALKQNVTRKKKSVIFFDEFPWIASRKSNFLQEFSYWWNDWASHQKLVVVICGSSASFMIDKVINHKGGLHNRVTEKIILHPFTLSETKQYLTLHNIRLNPYSIIQLYMVIGGIPHYLSYIKRGESIMQIINRLLLSKNALLRYEFENLYAALFDNHQNHVKVIKALAKKQKGLTRSEILKITHLKDGGAFSKVLEELKTSSFVIEILPFAKIKKDTLFRLCDEYSLFYLKFIEGNPTINKNVWSLDHKHRIWQGYAFENVCFKHVEEIKRALGISGVNTSVSSFCSSSTNDEKFQMDLLIDRADNTVNICELKFYNKPTKLSKSELEKINKRRHFLETATSTKKTLFNTLVTTYNPYKTPVVNEYIDNIIEISQFFD